MVILAVYLVLGVRRLLGVKVAVKPSSHVTVPATSVTHFFSFVARVKVSSLTVETSIASLKVAVTVLLISLGMDTKSLELLRITVSGIWNWASDISI